MITLLLFTDGRDELLERTLESAQSHLIGPITRRVIYDDTGDPGHLGDLQDEYPGYFILQHPQGRQGFGGAIRSAWKWVRTYCETPFIFHLEDDFLFNRPLYLEPMIAVLDQYPNVVQLALRRQPWNDQERAAGGVVEQHPEAYEEITYNGKPFPGSDEVRWLEQRLFFTTNPCLYRRKLILDYDWPLGTHTEGRFSHELLADPNVRFAFWGSRDSGEWVEHIGNERVGIGY